MSLNQRRLAASSRPRFKKTLLAVTLASLACSAGADEKTEQLELGAVVVTATGFEQSVKDAPAAITVISAEELKKRSYTDITDALKNVAGVQIAGGGVERWWTAAHAHSGPGAPGHAHGKGAADCL